LSSSTRSWWATSTARSRLTTVGASAIALTLSGVSYVVWTSPSGPVSQVTNVVEKVQAGIDLKLERNELLGEVASLKGDLSDSQAELTALQQELWHTKQDLVEARAAAGSSNSGGGGSSSSTKAPAATVKGPITAPSRAELAAPSSRYFGMYTAQAPFSWATFDDTSSKIGSRPNVVGYFSGWDEPFRAEAVTKAWTRDTMPMLTWESRPIGAPNSQVNEPDYTLPRILGDPANGVPGAFDDYLHQYAKDIVATGLPLAIRFDHEMNGTWYPWAEDNGKGGSINGNNPGDYVKVWQHVHDIFEQEGANDLVIWVWAPNIVNNLTASHKSVDYLRSLYPGDDYVDWVGLSGYLRPPYKADNDFTFEYTYGASLDQLRAITDKPIYLAEVGASEIEGHKAAWITSFFDGLAKPENDDIIGFSWFNLAVTTYVEGELATNDWRIDSRPESVAAFKSGIARPEDNFDLDPYP
jgi:mannan endo-1,4-beta-mannosidase